MFFDVFKRNTFAQIETFYVGQTHGESTLTDSWLALAINQRTIAESMLTKELVLAPQGLSIQIAELDHGLTQHIYHNNKKIFSGNLSNAEEIKNSRVLFNNFLDGVIQKEIKYFTEKLNDGKYNPKQLENEDKAVEWIRVSFEVLTKAVLESLTNPEFLFQSTFFCGVNPKTNKHEMRLMAFNLDMTFYLLDDNNLRVLIYNKKPGVEHLELKPVLMGDYSFRKREIFDHLINLLSVLSKGMHC